MFVMGRQGPCALGWRREGLVTTMHRLETCSQVPTNKVYGQTPAKRKGHREKRRKNQKYRCAAIVQSNLVDMNQLSRALDSGRANLLDRLDRLDHKGLVKSTGL